MNTTPLINKAAVKKLALKLSKENRAGKFTRVGSEFITRIHAKLEQSIRSEVQAHPSVGKTLM
jgi:hypothetical protein